MAVLSYAGGRPIGVDGVADVLKEGSRAGALQWRGVHARKLDPSLVGYRIMSELELKAQIAAVAAWTDRPPNRANISVFILFPSFTAVHARWMYSYERSLRPSFV